MRRLLAYLPLRRLDRYVMKQFLLAYVICSSSLLGLFMILEGLSRLERFMKQETNVILVFLHYYSATIPIYFSQYLGPVLTLIAAMFSLTLLNKGRELLPMKAAGISITRILAPCFFLAFVFALLQIGVQELMLPNLKGYIREATSLSKKKDFITPESVQDPEFRQTIHSQKFYPQRQLLENVLINQKTEKSNVRAIFQAQQGQWEKDGDRWFLVLENANVTRWDEQNRQLPKEDDEPRTFRIATNVQPIDFESSDREIPYLSYRELLQQYHRNKELTHLEVKLHQRFAFPLANVILLLLGLPFVLRDDRRSVLLGVAVAILISALYLVSTTICANLGNNATIPPALAAWLPVLFFGALGITLFDTVDS